MPAMDVRKGKGTEGSRTLPGGWPDALLGIGEVRSYMRREALHERGDAPDHIHLILFGKVLRVYVPPNGPETILDVYGRGDLVGVTAFLDGANHPDTARAHTRVNALVIPNHRFLSFVERNTEAGFLLRTQIGRRIRHDAARTASLAVDRVESRIRLLLWDLARRYGVVGDVRGTLLDLGLTRRELASLAGTALETVIRTVARLTEQGLLVHEGRRFFIPDVDALRPC